MSDSKTVTILDGGMGRELERRGAPFRQPEWSALSLMEAPEIVCDVHKAFIQSGAQVIMTNSYALVPFHIGEQRFAEQGEQLAALSGSLAREAVDSEGRDALVAGSIPPLFGSYRADLYQPERAQEVATPLIRGLAPHVDVWIAETQSLIAETVAVHSLVNQLDKQKRPFWAAFTIEDGKPTKQPALRSGESVTEAVTKMVELGVDAILFNCSQPEVMEDAVIVARETLQQLNAEGIQLGVYANAFPPQPDEATANDGLSEIRDDLNETVYVQMAKKWQQQGATLIGGCCGIGPEHIAAMSDALHTDKKW